MKQITWHIPREAPARLQVTGTVLLNSSYSSVFEKKSLAGEIVIPTELAVAVDLREIKRRLIGWYRQEVGKDPGVIVTVYRYPSGGMGTMSPIGVGLAACETVLEQAITVGKLEVVGEHTRTGTLHQDSLGTDVPPSEDVGS